MPRRRCHFADSPPADVVADAYLPFFDVADDAVADYCC